MATRTQERRLAFLATALPPIAWVVVFFLAPLAIVWAYSFGQNQGLTDVDISGTFANYARALQPLYLQILGKSMVVAGLTTMLCLVIGFPVALSLLFSRGRWRAVVLIVVLPAVLDQPLDPPLRADGGAAHRRLRQFHARLALESCQLAHDAGGLAAAGRLHAPSAALQQFCRGDGARLCASAVHGAAALCGARS